MSAPALKRCLYAAAGLLLASTWLPIRWALTDVPPPPVTPPRATTPSVARRVDSPVPRINPDVQLRRPLVDPPPKPVVVVARPKTVAPKPTRKPTSPAPKWTLVMTVSGPSGALAVVSDDKGKFDTAAEGETLDLQPSGGAVRSIGSDRVTIAWPDREADLTLQRSEQQQRGKQGRQGEAVAPDGGPPMRRRNVPPRGALFRDRS